MSTFYADLLPSPMLVPPLHWWWIGAIQSNTRSHGYRYGITPLGVLRMTVKKTVKEKSAKKKRSVKKKSAVKQGKKAKKKAKPKIEHPLMIVGPPGSNSDVVWDRVKVVDHICDCIVSSSLSIGSILKAGYEGYILPSYSTIMKWLDEETALADKYARAKEAQADYLADEMIEIADHGAEDVVMVNGAPLLINEKPIKVKTAVGVNHARLMIDTRKWLASKLKVKKYGDKVQQEVTGPDGGAIEHGIQVSYITAKPRK